MLRVVDDGSVQGVSAVGASTEPASLAAGVAGAFGLSRLLRSRLRRDIAGTFLAQGGILGLAALTGVISARLLGPSGRGDLAALTLWPMALLTFNPLAVNSAFVFHVGRREFSLAAVWTAGTVLGALQSVMMILAGLAVVPLALHGYPADVRRLAFIFLGFAPVIVFGGQPPAIFQGEMKITAYNAVRTLAPAVYAVGLVMLFLLRRRNLSDVVFCQLAGFVAAAGWGYSRLLRCHPFRFVWDAAALKSMVIFGWKTQLSNITAFVNQRMDQLLLSLFIPSRDLGLYVVAVTVTSIALVFPQAAGAVAYAAGASSSAPEAGRVIARSMQLSLVCLVVGCGLLFAVVPWAIPRVFGPAFAGSVLACRILLPGTVALGLCQVLYEGARALNQPALPSYAEGCSMIVTLACLALLVPRFGFVGAAIASSLAYTTSLMVTLALFRARAGIGWQQLLGRKPASRSGDLSPGRPGPEGGE